MPEKKKYKELRLVLGDQLNRGHSWFQQVNNDVLYAFMEVRPESEYVTHHIQKILAIFHGMRCFALELSQKGHQVAYYHITDTHNKHDFRENIEMLIEDHAIEQFCYQQPDEWRLQEQMNNLAQDLNISAGCVDTEHFFLKPEEFKNFIKSGKYFMEAFYRKMRAHYGILMEGDEPVQGKWNFDQLNRKKLPKNITPPQPMTFDHDVTEIFEEVQDAALPWFGSVEPEKFPWPVNRKEALELLDYFLEYLLPHFGDYQDALTPRSWSLFHSRLSFAMNVKMLSPKEVVHAVEDHWREHPEKIGVQQAEGFIRQILGWREYMRIIYWNEMPGYAEKNFFGADRSLPAFYWTGKTKMRCMQHAIGQSLEHAYAHHIQRLMITGNFGMMAGIHPDGMDAWYLGVYADAFEWVEITNTRGMSQFADGGIVGTKPYAASASYINKMGDYCRDCAYEHKKKHGQGACPFNSLYWNFIDQCREVMPKNPRMAMMYRVLDKMEASERTKILQQAKEYLENIESL